MPKVQYSEFIKQFIDLSVKSIFTVGNRYRKVESTFLQKNRCVYVFVEKH